MGIFDRLERSIERGVNGAFAKAFRSVVQPVEIASAMRRAMDDRAVSAGKGQRHIVPNLFVIELSSTDYEGLVAESDHETSLADDLIATASEHAESQRYQPGGPVSVQFAEDDSLETGVFRLRPSTARQVDTDRAPSRMPPARAHDDARRPAGHEPPHQGGFALPGRQEPSADRRRAQVPAQYDSDPAYADDQWYDEDPGDRRHEDDHDPRYARTGAAHEFYDVDADPRTDQQAGHRQADDAEAPGRWGRRNNADDHRPSPAAPRRLKQRPWLDVDGDLYPLLGSLTVIGRDDDVDIILDDPGVSRRHSEIRVTYDGPHQVITIRDLGSTNGTFVNGDPIDSVHLGDGDCITIGRTHLLLRQGGHR